MKNVKPGKKLRRWLVWTGWVILVQFILMNISAALYAYKLTHLKDLPSEMLTHKPVSRNVFSKTWRLFTGPDFYRQPLSDTPSFPFAPLQLGTENGIAIEAWYAKPDSASKGAVILFHGMTVNKGYVLDEASVFRDWGYSVLMVDVRSHGNSAGEVTTIGYKEAEEVKVAYDHIRSSGERKIVLWGASMGAVIIAKAIADYRLQPTAAIIEMPFLSLQSHLKGRARILGFPEQPFAFLTTFWIGAENGFNGFGFNTTRYAKNIHCPVMVQYGNKDELVQSRETEKVYQAIPSAAKKLVIYENARHESLLRNDPAAWKKEVSEFLEKLK
ncbi:MAG: alpha/beta hydrolase [Chitinophagaceae bacterium]|nr:alpha/beta hydrolase [Chitinophagaceae bacterium]